MLDPPVTGGTFGWPAAGALLVGGVIWGAMWTARREPPPSLQRKLLAVIGCTGLLLRLAFALETPVFYAPDERAHFRYVAYLYEHKTFPVETSKTGAATNDWEYYQPPLYYLAMLPLYGLAAHAFHGRVEACVKTIRLASVMLWLVTGWLFLRILAALAIRSQPAAAVAAAVVCLLPTYVFTSSMINNDNLVIALGGVLLLLLTRRSTAGSALLIGCVLGLAFLTKLSAIVYAVAVTGVLVLRAGTDLPRRTAALHLFVIAATALALYAPWGVRNMRLYGSVTAEDVANVPFVWSSPLYALRAVTGGMIKSFWAVSGIYNNVQFVPVVGAAVTVAALIGLARCLFVRREHLVQLFGADLPYAFATLIAIAVNILLVLRFGLHYGQGQGRFLFPLLVPLALWTGAALTALPLIGEKMRVHACGFFVTFACCFTAASLAAFPSGGR
jgi:hypothetical protein